MNNLFYPNLIKGTHVEVKGSSKYCGMKGIIHLDCKKNTQLTFSVKLENGLVREFNGKNLVIKN